MKITDKEVRYIADLAHVHLDEDEVSAYRADLEEILTYVEKLDELDTRHVEPMSHVLFPSEASTALRDDEPEPSMDRDKALSNAPLAGAGHFKTPLVIER